MVLEELIYMAQYHQTLIQQVLSLGASHAALLPVSQLPFDPSFRDLCRSNACGMYGACWMCPPYIGSSEELIEQAKAFEWALVYQTISPLEDSFDIEGMLAAGPKHSLSAVGERLFFLFAAGGRGLPQMLHLRKENGLSLPISGRSYVITGGVLH